MIYIERAGAEGFRDHYCHSAKEFAPFMRNIKINTTLIWGASADLLEAG